MLLVEGQYAVVQSGGCMIGAFPHVEKAEGKGSTGFYDRLHAAFDCVFEFTRTQSVLTQQAAGNPCFPYLFLEA